MPANSQLLALARSNEGWQLKKNRLRHKSGYIVQKQQAEQRWSAWPPVKIDDEDEVTIPEDYKPMINKFDTPEEAMAWCEENVKDTKPWD